MFCPYCGNKVAKGEKICPSCGHEFQEDDDSEFQVSSAREFPYEVVKTDERDQEVEALKQKVKILEEQMKTSKEASQNQILVPERQPITSNEVERRQSNQCGPCLFVIIIIVAVFIFVFFIL